MPKTKKIYTCNSCGYQTPTWEGRCRDCGQWNTLEEKTITVTSSKRGNNVNSNLLKQPININEINSQDLQKVSTGMIEFDRALSGGLVKGQVVLISGDPGVGKSTLLLQLSSKINKKVLYVSAEENESQFAIKATRMGLDFNNVEVFSTVDIESVLNAGNYDLLIIDSIQMFSDSSLDNLPGSSSQIRVVCNRLIEYAKSTGTICIIVGHITKDGMIAGPKTLEHMVDTVLYLEGDKRHSLRLLRVSKNRFGTDTETGIFEMTEKGLQDIKNISSLNSNDISLTMPGSTLSVVMEGTRPVIVEIQALVSKTAFGYPKRAVSGFSLGRLNLLCAVMQKRAGINLLDQDVYINVVSGFNAKEPAVDLAVCASIISSYLDRAIKPDSVFIGEVGLSGETRSVINIVKRIKEAKNLGYKNIYYVENLNKIDQLKKTLL